MMTSIGSAGIGLVWGWLWGMWLVPPVSWRALVLLVFSTSWLGLLALWLADGRGLGWLGGTAVIGFSVHYAWREYLIDKRGE